MSSWTYHSEESFGCVLAGDIGVQQHCRSTGMKIDEAAQARVILSAEFAEKWFTNSVRTPTKKEDAVSA